MTLNDSFENIFKSTHPDDLIIRGSDVFHRRHIVSDSAEAQKIPNVWHRKKPKKRISRCSISNTICTEHDQLATYPRICCITELLLYHFITTNKISCLFKAVEHRLCIGTLH
jgi:hypothetical protein